MERMACERVSTCSMKENVPLRCAYEARFNRCGDSPLYAVYGRKCTHRKHCACMRAQACGCMFNAAFPACDVHLFMRNSHFLEGARQHRNGVHCLLIPFVGNFCTWWCGSGECACGTLH
ncbi:hypothetical protein VCUG_02057 [Vavraia culicis subsp. floridensis]|uniref:Uncharacterized protein n=1 Tax=Vavraia culicis (isolate floridensis) TaxID=948595 RepID=L2GSX6_VAVCU|nr:uncharacterized protein VCUG_02057 [Vavraia culicis subsp. floridensis]ELA46462.1 hypothetical protein VCUG_02057 [Vavraia culicis subsp. floridensis]